ncbi:MAG: hypothetical protein KJO69_08585 [Gammaproteobacteria bacterium]|nr:hypothetical protein [Gammaproteobacteria bacterium]
MPDLLEKLYEVRKAQSGSLDLDDIKEKIDAIPRFDNEQVLSTISQSMMGFFNRHYELETGRKEAIVKEIIDTLEKDLLGIVKSHKNQFDAVTKKLVTASNQISKSIDEAKKVINEAQGNGVTALDKAIKGIKPTDVSQLEKDVNNLINVVGALSKKKPPKQEKVNLTPVLDALKEPKKKIVEFEVKTDLYGFPEKVIATEITRGK